MKSVYKFLIKFLSYFMMMIKFMSSFYKVWINKESSELHDDSEHHEKGDCNESSSNENSRRG